MKGILAGRRINDITINPLEYLLDDAGDEMVFKTEEDAKDFLRKQGFTDEDMEYLVFEEADTEYRWAFRDKATGRLFNNYRQMLEDAQEHYGALNPETVFLWDDYYDEVRIKWEDET